MTTSKIDCIEGRPRSVWPPASSTAEWPALRERAAVLWATNMLRARRTGAPKLDRTETPDQLVVRSLGGMPGNAQLAKLKERAALRSLADVQGDAFAALQRRWPRYRDPLHPHSVAYRREHAKLVAAHYAKTAIAVTRNHPDLYATARAEDRAWMARIAEVVTRGRRLLAQRDQGAL